MSPSRHRICCTCARCLTICPSGVWRPQAAMTSHLRRVQYETQPRRSVTPDRAIASTSQICESVYTVLRRVLTMSFRCQPRSQIPVGLASFPASGTNSISASPQSHETQLLTDAIALTLQEEEDREEDASIESLSSRLFAHTLNDDSPDINGHSRLWSSRADFQDAREPSHTLPQLNQSPVEPLIASTQRLLDPTAVQSLEGSSGPQHSPFPPIPSTTNPSSQTVPPHSHRHNRHIQVLANIESRILRLGNELSRARGAEVAQIQSQLQMLHGQLEKIHLKSVEQVRDRLFNALRPLFIICAAHTTGETQVSGPFTINSGEIF